MRFIAHNRSPATIYGARLILGHSVFNLIRDPVLTVYSLFFSLFDIQPNMD